MSGEQEIKSLKEEIKSLEQTIRILNQEITFRKKKAIEADCALAAFGRAANSLVEAGPKFKDAVNLFVDSYFAALNEYKLSLEIAKEATSNALETSYKHLK